MRHPPTLAAAFATAALLVLTSSAHAQFPVVVPGAPQQVQPVVVQADAVNDATLTTAIAASGMAEVAISELALQRSQNEQIREFAQTLIRDHTQANNELRQLASERLIPIPAQLQFTDRATAEILARLSGSKFDREFAKNQVAGHLCAVALLQAGAEHAQDPQIRAFAAKYLPIVEGHLKRAGELAGIAIPAGSTKEIEAATPATAIPPTERPADGTVPTELPSAETPPAEPAPAEPPSDETLPAEPPADESLPAEPPAAEAPPAEAPTPEPAPAVEPPTDETPPAETP